MFSCNNGPAKPLKDSDSLNGMTVRELKEKYIDSMKQSVSESTLTSDTIGMSIAPIRVIKSYIVKKEYSSYRDIRLVYKNFSKKKVTAIRFQWYGINSFGEPADMGYSGFLSGHGGGFTDDVLSPGRTDDGEWSITSRDAKKVIAAWATEVVFEDGSKWENKKRN